MITTQRHGDGEKEAVSAPRDRLVAACGTLSQAALTDVAAALESALAAPIDFPTLAQAVLPGDRVVLALDRDVPSSEVLVETLFRALVDCGVNPEDVTLLVHEMYAGREDDARSLLPEAFRNVSTIEVHRPEVRTSLSYLAAGQRDEPLYVNRTLCDADFAIPIRCLRCEPALAYHGLHGELYPTFADRKAQSEIAKGTHRNGNRAEVKLREQIQQVGWLMGVQFGVQVVPAGSGGILRVLAGGSAEIFRIGQQACQEAWMFAVPRTAQLVVASIDGPASEQTWDNVARALFAASRVVSVDGSIALCVDLDEPPSALLRQLADVDDLERVIRRVRKEGSRDGVNATAIGTAMQQARVYLHSRLEAEDVEGMGMVPLRDKQELERLIASHSSCILIANAQYAVVLPEDA